MVVRSSLHATFAVDTWTDVSGKCHCGVGHACRQAKCVKNLHSKLTNPGACEACLVENCHEVTFFVTSLLCLSMSANGR